MAEFMAWAMTYDISASGKGCLRIISMETDANTVICVSLYDTLENCTARIGSEARVKDTWRFCDTQTVLYTTHAAHPARSPLLRPCPPPMAA